MELNERKCVLEGDVDSGAEKVNVELLAPAGDEECFKAAIAAGADAVYFGLEQFSARTRAKNITVEQARRLIPLAHSHGCRAYLTLNTLIKDSEMPQALSLVEKAVECGVDAVIVQDLGVLKAVRDYFPSLEIHASTQMTTHNLSQCKFLAELGVSQVNLSRELSLAELRDITDFLHSRNIVPEVFVQGAFCISYSGQCYLSGHLYGQAGNRGDCVQPCRRCWSSAFGGESRALESRALFHLKDNSAFPLADRLIKENLPVSLKIEGRIKNAEYVWAVTSAWREQIDLVLAEKQIQKSSPKLTGAINRDYTCGYLEGNISGQMFSSGAKDVSQVKAGTVEKYIAATKTLVLNSSGDGLREGDRLTIKTASNQFICTATVKGLAEAGFGAGAGYGESVGYTIQITNKLTKKILGGQIVYKSTSAISPEDLAALIKNIDPSADGETESSCNSRGSTGGDNCLPVDISVCALEDKPIEVTYSCGGQSASVKSEQVLVKAQNAGLTSDTLKQKLTKLGGTSFIPGNFTVEQLDPNLFIPLGELNALRRKAVEQLEFKIESKLEKTESACESKCEAMCGAKIAEINLPVPNASSSRKAASASAATASVEAHLVDTKTALENLLQERLACNRQFKIIYELPSAMNLVQEDLFHVLNNNPDVVLSFNSILLDSDLKASLAFLKRLDCLYGREIICGNTGLAYELKGSGCKIILGANCNLYNSWNIENYCQSLGAGGVVPSLELSPEVLDSLCFPDSVEVWYPKKIHALLMQSRQCLVKNGSGCSKSCVDRECLEKCSKKFLVKGTQGEKVLALKRPGFYSALYTAEEIICMAEKFSKQVSVWIVDRRF